MHCQPLKAGRDPALSATDAQQWLQQLPEHWHYHPQQLQSEYSFTNYESLLQFVQALGWLAQQQDHHPRMILDYCKLTVIWTTHSIQAVSLNDFICAARCERLFQGA